MVDEGRFLEDFFYRINDFPLTVPPLRERREDIPLLMNHYIDKLARDLGRAVEGATAEFLDRLSEYYWPGNVRELEKVIKRALILAEDGELLDLRHLAPEVMRSIEPAEPATRDSTLRERIEKIEQAMILDAMRRLDGNKSQVAMTLGISYPNLLSKIKRYNIQ
jgi:transcriptional regulator with PAS, ATPase and Fis domain